MLVVALLAVRPQQPTKLTGARSHIATYACMSVYQLQVRDWIYTLLLLWLSCRA